VNLKLKKQLDNRFGRIALIFLNGLAWILGKILRIDHDALPVRVVVVAKFQGIGSLIMAKPALRLLRLAHPSARVVFWGTPSTAALAAECPEFDEILVLSDRSLLAAVVSVSSNLRRLWSERADWFFDLEPYSYFSAVLATLSCARNRAGFVFNVVPIRRYAYSHLVFLNRYRYLGEAYARLLGLAVPGGTEEQARDFGPWKFRLEPAPAVPKPYVAVNIHAGDLALERRWPKESFEALIDALLASDPALRVVLIGHGAFEAAESARIRRRERLIDLSGRLTLAETFRTLAHAALVVSGDSAPLHMAVSLDDVPVLGLYGPTRPLTYFCPWRKNALALSVDIYCSPCVHHWNPPPCLGDNQCMKRLSARDVARACGTLLKKPVEAAETASADAGAEYYPGLLYHNKLW
jgi:ADP-heptose:LPS heptosyltransferase